MPATYEGVASADVHALVKLLTTNLVNTKDETGKFLLRLDDGRVIDTKGWNEDNWEWTHGVGLYGIWKYYEQTDDPASLLILQTWFTARLAAGGTTKNINTMAPFLSLALLYERFHTPSHLPWLDAWASWAMHDLPRTTYGGMQHMTYLSDHTQQLWDDTLMMTVLPLARIGRVLGRRAYVDEAKAQFLLHIKYLFDTRTGLFFHGWTFGEGGHNFAGALWARGNSWLTIVIPEFLELLEEEGGGGEDTFFRRHLVDTLHAQVTALQKYQEPSGLWRTVIDHDDAASYEEASATAGFAYGILKGIRKRYIGKEFYSMAIKAIKGVIANIDEKGELQNTSFGTPMGLTKDFYKEIPRTSMPYGQAMAIMALGEFLRHFL